MLLEMNVFGELDPENPNSWKAVLNASFDDFVQWRKLHRIQCSQKRFSYKTLVRPAYGYFLNAKGYNARVVSEWLLAKLIAIRAAPGNLIFDERFDLAESTLNHGFALQH